MRFLLAVLNKIVYPYLCNAFFNLVNITYLSVYL